jgi:hypothetical protein
MCKINVNNIWNIYFMTMQYYAIYDIKLFGLDRTSLSWRF